MVIKDLFLSTALLNRFIMSPRWIFGFCCICSVDITPSWGCCGVEHRLHGLSLQGERLIWGVVLGEAKLPSVFDFGYVSILFFLSVKVSGAGEGRAEGRENAPQVSHKCYFFGCGMPSLSDIVNLLPMNPRTQKKSISQVLLLVDSVHSWHQYP